jgi:hypothetical protein
VYLSGDDETLGVGRECAGAFTDCSDKRTRTNDRDRINNGRGDVKRNLEK